MKRIATLTALCALIALPLLAADAPAKPSAACCLKSAGAQRNVTNLDNGVKITITGGDAKLATMIQEETATCPKPGCSKDCPMQAKGVSRTVERTENGVVITATASNPELVKKLQEHAATQWDQDCPHKAGKACAKGEAGAPKCPHAKGGTPTQS
jgi:anaerobic selenocysteine-containing dehydrogenase